MIRLRPLDKKDVNGMLSWMKDADINQYFRMNAAGANEESVLKYIMEAESSDKNLHRAIVDEDDNYLGTISLKEIDYDSRNAEYAISMCGKAHGTGAAKFATDQILKIAFQELNLNRVYLNVLTENTRANKFYLKYGFVYEGEFKEHLLVRGELKDLKWYRMLKSEFEILNENN